MEALATCLHLPRSSSLDSCPSLKGGKEGRGEGWLPVSGPQGGGQQPLHLGSQFETVFSQVLQDHLTPPPTFTTSERRRMTWSTKDRNDCKPHHCLLSPGTCCCGCSVAKLCLTLCDPMDYSMPGFPVLHHLPEFTQTHAH